MQTRSRIVDGKKLCPGCKTVKSIEEYSKNRSKPSGIDCRCRVCHSADVKAQYARNPAPQRRVTLRLKFDLTPEQYDEMLAAQGGVCAICKKPETNTYRGIVRSLAVDHDHATSENRDLLCSNCNQGLGRFDDDPDLLLAAAAYVLRHRALVDIS